MENSQQKIVIIRDKTEQDRSDARLLHERVFASMRKVYRPTPELAATRADNNAQPGLIARLNEELIGIVRYDIKESRLHFMGLAVHPDHRRRGVARLLIDRLRAIARDRGIEQISLYTVEETGNVAVFEGLGFVVVTREPAQGLESPTGQQLTEAFMVLSLPSLEVR